MELFRCALGFCTGAAVRCLSSGLRFAKHHRSDVCRYLLADSDQQHKRKHVRCWFFKYVSYEVLHAGHSEVHNIRGESAGLANLAVNCTAEHERFSTERSVGCQQSGAEIAAPVHAHSDSDHWRDCEQFHAGIPVCYRRNVCVQHFCGGCVAESAYGENTGRQVSRFVLSVGFSFNDNAFYVKSLS